MAENEQQELQIEKNGSKKIIIIAAIVVLVLVAAAAFFFMSGDDADTAVAANNDNAAPTANVQKGSALYVAMPQPFLFNVPGATRDRVVEIKVQLMVRGEDNEETAKKHIPLIRSALLGVFANSTAEELSTAAGKETLRESALTQVQESLANIEGVPVVERVLFTGFVMQ